MGTVLCNIYHLNNLVRKYSLYHKKVQLCQFNKIAILDINEQHPRQPHSTAAWRHRSICCSTSTLQSSFFPQFTHPPHSICNSLYLFLFCLYGFSDRTGDRKWDGGGDMQQRASGCTLHGTPALYQPREPLVFFILCCIIYSSIMNSV